jgi:hypothetical protein
MTVKRAVICEGVLIIDSEVRYCQLEKSMKMKKEVFIDFSICSLCKFAENKRFFNIMIGSIMSKRSMKMKKEVNESQT